MTGARVLVAIMPLAATAGTPIPGKLESPHSRKALEAVLGPGNVSAPAHRAGVTSLMLSEQLCLPGGVRLGASRDGMDPDMGIASYRASIDDDVCILCSRRTPLSSKNKAWTISKLYCAEFSGIFHAKFPHGNDVLVQDSNRNRGTSSLENANL